ncbi:hypothetical protein ACFVHQ_03310 [Actinomycetes bacterium NPDC127524]
MNKKFLLILAFATCILFPAFTLNSYAEGQTADKFYNSLSAKEYKEYKHAKKISDKR